MNVLTTGFDAPGIDLLAMLRPTKSKGLYVQMTGRGTRTAPAKTDCLVLDFARNIDRHGPIDKVVGDVMGDKGDGGAAPIKICPECGREVFTAVRVCDCGFEFPPIGPPPLEVKASEAAILSTQVVAQWVDVDRITYAAYVKPDKPTSLLVTYSCGLMNYREWVCLEHRGPPRERAGQWWRAHSATPLPDNVDAALQVATAGQLRQPTSIRVKPDGKFFNIQSHRFT
jgi:DNA repair protein RadD